MKVSDFFNLIQYRHLFVLLAITSFTSFYAMSCNPEPMPKAKVNKSVHKIRVALKHKENELIVQTLNPFILTEVDDKEGVTSKKMPAELLDIKVVRGQISINGRSYPGNSYYLKHTGVREGTWSVDRKMYIGKLRLHKSTKNQLSLILYCDMERYVASSVSGESGVHFSEEALKCQAVACRSFAWFRIKKEPRARSLFDVYPDTRDQMFMGLRRIKSKHVHAANATFGQVLKYNGDLFGSFYHSTCGGHTVNAIDMKLVHHPTAVLTGRECRWCKEAPLYRWKHYLKIDDFKEKFDTLKWRKIYGVELVTRSGGHLSQVIFKTDKHPVIISAKVLRKTLGYSKVRSYRFTVKIEEGLVKIDGRGLGHGVGMCQYGTEGMAKQGKKYKEILGYYFPGSRVSEYH